MKDKIRLKECISIKTTLPDMLRDYFKKMRALETQVQREKMAMSMYLSVIPLNVNGFSVPIKRHMVAEWMRKHDLHICCLQETHLRTKEQTESERMEKIFQANGHKRKLG